MELPLEIYISTSMVTSRYISTSPKRKLRNNIDVIDYFAGDNKIWVGQRALQ